VKKQPFLQVRKPRKSNKWTNVTKAQTATLSAVFSQKLFRNGNGGTPGTVLKRGYQPGEEEWQGFYGRQQCAAVSDNPQL